MKTMRLLGLWIGLQAVLLAAAFASIPDRTSGAHSPVFGISMPADYRDWRLITVAREEARAFLEPQIEGILRAWRKPALKLRLVRSPSGDS